jgi:hypothetical protein
LLDSNVVDEDKFRNERAPLERETAVEVGNVANNKVTLVVDRDREAFEK